MPEENALSLKDILASKKPAPKAPAHPWQDLALQIIAELNIPAFKRNSVFKVCRDFPRARVMNALNDTKELCVSGEKWKYFFKVIDGAGGGRDFSNTEQTNPHPTFPVQKR